MTNPLADRQRQASLPGLAARLWSAGRAVTDALLPQNCVLCGLPSGSAPVCSDCAATFPSLSSPACPRCALPLSASFSPECPDCRHHRPGFNSAIAVWSYGFPIDTLIRDFKYGHHLYLANFFGRHLAVTLEAHWQVHPDNIPDLILPLPLHPNRLKSRGFNQAAEITRQTARQLNLPWAHDRLLRLHDTASQAGLRRDARWANLRGAFACPTPVTDLKILLIDDVLTTGASLSACADVLRHAGARQIDVAVLARTPDPGNAHFAQPQP